MMIKKYDSIDSEDVGSGVKRKILNHGGSLMMVEFHFKKGGVGPVHTHPHEQIGYLAKGSGIFELAGKKEKVEVGDTMYMPSNVPHGFVALEEDTVLIDVFTPQREDFLQ